MNGKGVVGGGWGGGEGGGSRSESKRQLLQFPLALASFTDFKAFFPAMMTDFHEVVPVKN